MYEFLVSETLNKDQTKLDLEKVVKKSFLECAERSGMNVTNAYDEDDNQEDMETPLKLHMHSIFLNKRKWGLLQYAYDPFLPKIWLLKSVLRESGYDLDASVEELRSKSYEIKRKLNKKLNRSEEEEGLIQMLESFHKSIEKVEKELELSQHETAISTMETRTDDLCNDIDKTIEIHKMENR